VIIFLDSVPREAIYSFLICKFPFIISDIVLQLVYLCSIIYLHPFENVVHNVVEIVNEVFLTLILLIMFTLNNESKWLTFQDYFFGVLTINSLMIVSILSSKL